MAAIHHPKREIHKHPPVELSIKGDSEFYPAFIRMAASADKSRPQAFLAQLWQETNTLREQIIAEELAQPLPDTTELSQETSSDSGLKA